VPIFLWGLCPHQERAQSRAWPPTFCRGVSPSAFRAPPAEEFLRGR